MNSTKNSGGVIEQENVQKAQKSSIEPSFRGWGFEKFLGGGECSSISNSSVHWAGILYKRHNCLYLLCGMFVSLCV